MSRKQEEVPEAGGDLDSQLRELKARRATAEASGDDDAVKAADQAIERLNAGVQRRDAAQADRTRPPQGRSASSPAKSPTGGTTGGGSAGAASTAKDKPAGESTGKTDKDK